jgi:hypothetical protein
LIASNPSVACASSNLRNDSLSACWASTSFSALALRFCSLSLRFSSALVFAFSILDNFSISRPVSALLRATIAALLLVLKPSINFCFSSSLPLN